jgi:hypothetical protein
MKKLRIILSAFAFVFAITAAYAFVQQQAWFKPAIGSAQIGTITEPVSTDAPHQCEVKSGTQCKIGTRDAYLTENGANTLNANELLRYN